MAFLQQEQDEIFNAGNQSGEQITSAPSFSGAGVSPSNAPQTAVSGSQGTGFVNLQDYLDANKEQTGRFAQDVANKIGEQRQGFLSSVGQAQTDFANQLNSSNPLDRSVVDLAANNPLGLTAQQVADFQRLANANFVGANSLQGTDSYRTLTNSLQDLLNTADLTQNESGRNQLISEYADNPTRGQIAFDQALLQGSPEAQTIFGNLRQQISGDQSAIDSAVTESANLAKARQDALGELSRSINEQFLAGLDTGSRFQPAVKTSQDRAGILAQLQQGLEGRATQANRDAAGRLRQAYGRSAPQFNVDAEQIATADDFAREAAYERLFGRDFDVLENSRRGEAGNYLQILEDLIAAAPSRQNNLPPITGNINTNNPVTVDPSRNQIQSVPVSGTTSPLSELQPNFKRANLGNSLEQLLRIIYAR